MSTSALALRVNRQLLRAIGDTLDGVKIAICVFDDEDRSVFWNRTFLEVFPEHVGKVYEGEPYRENLHRFYTARLSPADLPNIEQFISMGIDRHHSQMRPYSFDHRDQRVHVSSLPLPSGQRVRIWNAEKRHHSELPIQALATNAVVVSEETATLLDRLADGVMICDHDGMLKWVNQAFVDMYACRDKQECLNHSFFYIYEKAWQQEQTPSSHTTKKNKSRLDRTVQFLGCAL